MPHPANAPEAAVQRPLEELILPAARVSLRRFTEFDAPA